MIPSSNPFKASLCCLALFVAGALVLGCGSSRASFATASELPEGPRKPDGVAVDPASAPPKPRDVATTEGGLVTLRTPLGVEQAIETVSRFFQSIVAEDTDALEVLFTRDALAINASGGGPMGSSASATLFWTQRLRRLDYTKLAGEVLFREAELEVYRSDDALEAKPHPSIRAEALSPSDVVVRVPVVTSRVGSDRLLGEEMLLWLRRDADKFRIYRVLEDFQMP